MNYLEPGFYNMDCMTALKEYPNNYFDLAIVDPPYGIGVGSMTYAKGVAIAGDALAKRRDYRINDEWDTTPPPQEYFDELLRVSKNQIIWGGNYFTDKPKPTKSWIVWDKRCADNMRNSFADCELAWASKGVARVYRYLYNGMLQGNMKNKDDRIHPTQKPVELYEWLLNNYAKPGDKILDTHVGSASSLIACHRLGFEYTGFELNKDYYAKAKERLEAEKAQYTIFDFIGR